MRRGLALVLWLWLVAPAAAQETVTVSHFPDAASYVTAGVNPAVAAWKAIHSDDPQCQLSRLAISEGIVNGAGLLLQRFIPSPRPCAGSPGCSGNGMPSLHAANSVLGLGAQQGWGITFGVSMSVGTAGLRWKARRHDPWQVAAGLGLGLFGEWAGHRLVRCESGGRR